jgi:hypothetical protein
MMMQLLLLFALVVTAAQSAKTPCPATPAHSKAFTEYTSGQLLAIDMTLPVYDLTAAVSCKTMSNKQMREVWRSAEYDLAGFDCDHIIDVANVPGIPDNVGRDIAANKIPALSRWNRGMGQLCWRDAEAEKRKIYGDDIVNNALAAVKKCAGNGNAGGDTSAVTPDTPNMWMILAILSTSAFIIFVAIGGAVICYNRRKSARPAPPML